MKENTTNATTDLTEIRSIINSYMSDSRPLAELEDLIDIAAFMMYATYVSRNYQILSINLDPIFQVDAAPARMGNDYVAHQFVEAYEMLESPCCKLPHVEFDLKRRVDMQKAILAWVRTLDRSSFPLKETEGFDIAHSIAGALEEVYSMDDGRLACQFASYTPLAKLIVSLGDVNGKSVFDPACGFGSFLAEASFAGASSLTGSDIDPHALQRARLLTFFADPRGSIALASENSLLRSEGKLFDRILCAPPLGMRITRSDIEECAHAVMPLEDGTAPSGPHGEDYFIARTLAELNDDGIAVLHVSPSFLYQQQKSRREFRQALVAQGHIDAVIELAGGCVPGTAVKSAIIILSKNPSERDVLLIDATSEALEGKGFFDQTRRQWSPTKTGIKWLTETVRNREEIPSVSILVPRERIVETDADLCFATYGDVYTDEVKTRPTSDILADIGKSHDRAEKLDAQIGAILTALRGDAK